MRSQKSFSLAISLLILSVVLYMGDRFGLFTSVRFLVSGLFTPVEKQMQTLHTQVPFFQNQKIKQLEEENQNLLAKVASYSSLLEENNSLREEVGSPPPQQTKLILAHVVSTSYSFIIDKGSNDGMKQNMNVVYKNYYIGKLSIIGKTTSRVELPVNKESTIEVAVNGTNTKGLLQGTGTEMTLSQVLISEQLQKNDLIETIGSSDANGVDIYPHLLVGQIDTVRESKNQLFQEAKIVPLVDYATLQTVFVME